jgi:hypothetical protein
MDRWWRSLRAFYSLDRLAFFEVRTQNNAMWQSQSNTSNKVMELLREADGSRLIFGGCILLPKSALDTK